MKVGGDWKLYYNSATNASPTWVEIKKVGDVNLDIEITAAPVLIRETVFDLNLPARIKVNSLDMDLAVDISGTVWEALRGFAFNRTNKQFAVCNASIATNGTQGFKFFAFFNKFPFNQPLSELVRGSATVVPAYQVESSALVEPAWFTISA